MMRKRFKFPMLALGLLAGGLLTSCSTENEPAPNAAGNMLVKAPQVMAYSGGHLWTDKFNNAGDGDINNQIWPEYGADQLTNITDDERRAVLEAIAKKATGEKISEDVVFPWTAYFLQDVISAQNGSFSGAGSSGTPSTSYSFEAWKNGADCRVQNPWYTDYNHTDDYANYELVTNSGHLNNYYQKQNPNGSQERINETTLMTDMEYGTYDEMKGKQFRWYVNCHENLHWSEYIVVEVDGSYYICFDFACGHKENDVDGNPGRGCTVNDWDYNDWVLKISPAGPQPDVWTGDEPQEETCDKCEHPRHDDQPCPDCEEGTVCHPEEPGDLDPEEPGDLDPDSPKHQHNDEVEINLGVDEKDGYKESHLSIHVRSVTDVEVFIPVPAQYYCDADDMAIVLEHAEDFMIHGGPLQTQFNVNGTVVTLNLEFQAGGIRIWTDGIDENVINFCREKYDDGITFEVWNYFNDAVDFELLKSYLNQATVKFLDKLPGAYINAFGEENFQENKDCTVDIIEEQRGNYNDPVEGTHLNNSAHNQIYDKK